MSPLDKALLGLAIFFFLLLIGFVLLNGFYRRKDRKVQMENEEMFRKVSTDNQRLATEYSETLSTLVDYFFAYQGWRSTEKDSRERIDVTLELSALWEKLPKDARKLLLPIAEPVGLKIKD